ADALVRLLDTVRRDALRRMEPPPLPVPPAGDRPKAAGLTLWFVESHNQFQQFQRVASRDTTLLLTGESGTGKTLLARAIHDSSGRKDGPFQIVDCGVLSPNLIESEMFGHAKGSFTGADRERIGKFSAAAGGTLVLDEINSLPIPLQCKLLRVVEE